MARSVTDALNFVRVHHRGVLATLRANGTPQLSPVLVGVDNDGTLVVSTRETAIKTRNIRRRPWASVCVFEDAFYGEWVQAEGTASVESVPDAMEGLVRYYRGISGEHPDWDDFRAAMIREKRVLLRIHVTRVGPSAGGT